MNEWLVLFGANLLFIALKAFQQINVVTYKWRWVSPTSFLMGQAEVWITGTIAAVFIMGDTWHRIAAGLVLGTAGSLGSLISMRLQRWLAQRELQPKMVAEIDMTPELSEALEDARRAYVERTGSGVEVPGEGPEGRAGEADASTLYDEWSQIQRVLDRDTGRNP